MLFHSWAELGVCTAATRYLTSATSMSWWGVDGRVAGGDERRVAGGGVATGGCGAYAVRGGYAGERGAGGAGL